MGIVHENVDRAVELLRMKLSDDLVSKSVEFQMLERFSSHIISFS